MIASIQRRSSPACSPLFVKVLTGLWLLLSGCQPQPQTLLRFQEHNAAEAGIGFQNNMVEDARHNMIDYSYCYNGGGAGAADLDNDGLTDLFFTGNQNTCRAYRNLGNWRFEDRTSAAGLSTTGWCSGVTFADVNADGWLDIYVCRAGNYPPEERRNLLFINQKNFSFVEKAAEYGLADAGWSTQAAFFDYDRDGDLDCFVVNHSNDDRFPNRIKEKRNFDGSDPGSDRLYQNTPRADGSPAFSPTRLLGDDGWGLGVAVSDFDGDGWPDLYVSNDFLANDLLWLNQRNGTFREVSSSVFGHTSHFSMGVDAADFDNDGRTDLLVADMQPSTARQRRKMAGVLSNDAFNVTLQQGYAPQYMRNTLQWNLGNHPADGLPRFAEIGQMAGINATDWSWAPLWADFDLDGRLDAVVTSGYRHDISDLDFIAQNSRLGGQKAQGDVDQQIRERARQQAPYDSPVRFFWNRGDHTLADSTEQWSSGAKGFHNGAVTADLDNDGDLDVVVNRLDAAPLLLENAAASTRNWLKIKLSQPGANPLAIGARVQLWSGGQAQTREVASTHGYLSANATELHFGLNTAAQADSLCVTWPDGSRQTLSPVATRQVLIVQKNAPPPSLNPKPSTLTPKLYLLNPKPSTLNPTNPFNDFAAEPLLPHRLSNETWPLTTGDVNGDGLTDLFVGAPTRQSGVFYLQQKNGTWKTQLLEPEPFDPLKPATSYSQAPEDTGATLFDADGDGDLDLYVVSGGPQFEPKSVFLQDRLYLNDGKGQFTAAPAGSVPDERVPGSCVAAADFDHDGDLDLFVGGRRQTVQYGVAGESFLWENIGKGIFRDVTDQRAPGLHRIGMVTCAVWLDANADGWPELAVGGELMPLTLLRNRQGQFGVEVIAGTEGLWRCLAVADLNADGQPDLLAGNLGLNQPFGASADTPFSVYAADFDNNGFVDPIATYFVGKQEITFHGRDVVCRQIPPLRKRFVTYAPFAEATFATFFEAQKMQSATVSRAVEMRSLWLENRQGQFSAHPLPNEVQTAPVQSFAVGDWDHDGRPDVLLAGNDWGWDVSVGRLDAGHGWLLRRESATSGSLVAVPPAASGWWLDGETRTLATLPGSVLVSTQTNGKVLIFK